MWPMSGIKQQTNKNINTVHSADRTRFSTDTYIANSETNINVNRLQRVRKIATSKVGELVFQAKMLKFVSLGEALIRTYSNFCLGKGWVVGMGVKEGGCF